MTAVSFDGLARKWAGDLERREAALESAVRKAQEMIGGGA